MDSKHMETRIGIYPRTGYSLIEILITSAILCILILMSTPSFSTLLSNNRINSQINEFHFSLLLARSEAVKRISRVSLCRSTSGTSCTSSGGWEQGWIVFVDYDNDGVVDHSDTPPEIVLQSHSSLDGGNTLRGNHNFTHRISYIGSGRTTQFGTVVLCDKRGILHGRAIVINAAGRPSIRDATVSSFTDCAKP